jgi:hypothetical protein
VSSEFGFYPQLYIDLKSPPPLQEVKGAGAGLTAAVLLAMVNYTAGIRNSASFSYI